MITLVGLGSGDIAGLSIGARNALDLASKQHQTNTGKLFLRTQHHPVVEQLKIEGLTFETFDFLYESSSNFAEVYAKIALSILDFAFDTPRKPGVPVTFAVPGHPLFAEDSVRQIRQAAKERGIPVKIIASGSFVEAVLTAVGIDLGDGCDVRDALTLPERDEIDPSGFRLPGRPDSARSLLLYQVFDRDSASRTKLALMQDYPDDWEIALVKWAGVPGHEQVLRIPLYRLDREPVDYLTSVFVPALPPELRRYRLPDLIGLMARLRAPDGCPWDREQTSQSLRKFLIEETYEAIEAIDTDDPELLCEELGDVLLQVVFHAQLASETGEFTIDDVTQGIVEKLVRRHPHVFAHIKVDDSEEVLRNWEAIKKEEKKDNDRLRRVSALDGVPAALPALMQAMDISKKAAKVGFEWGSVAEVLDKLNEEISELKIELEANVIDTQRVSAEIGDLLFTVVQIARWNGVDAEEALRLMIARFQRRFRFMESAVASTGQSLNELGPAELDELWELAKVGTSSA